MMQPAALRLAIRAVETNNGALRNDIALAPPAAGVIVTKPFSDLSRPPPQFSGPVDSPNAAVPELVRGREEVADRINARPLCCVTDGTDGTAWCSPLEGPPPRVELEMVTWVANCSAV